ncbi:hypothetical protein [Streptomyces cucumeris]|uniref:beta barrel domain-containing protein n=1 Tax=Streptomyces cucumeris TaxID=2962890 RepID=UPI0020C84559|nr:hypothetical protein [Streptomyces sp. NEAU-Y11]MCP9209635.1 hypothetical protein [Streptomyces sp. NEAU-Y11]
MRTDWLVGVKVGDPLILVSGNRYRGDEPVTVSRVGRQYLYVAANGREKRERFDRKTGIENSNTGVRERLCTPEQYEEMDQRSALLANLRDAGIDVRHEARSGMTTETLKALLAVMQAKSS